ncbi:MAG: ABC transporter ATP-binding protein, partial [Planctomycetaceae bacterium]|nr:ABC transporter ATP-binding protein [Planctomycetaceae bacterium]
MSFVQIEGLSVSYGKVHAVRGISFEIPQGEVFGFIGPNGAGKSTTIKVLATLLKPDSGHVSIDGIDVPKYPMAIRRRIGYMPDFFGVYEDLTAAEYLHFYAAAFQIPRSRRDSTIGDVLALTDLTEKAQAPVDSLSRGMKQRLALARVLLHDPDLLLLDEPASGLDPRARIEVRELLKALQGMGKTILISSHILHELAQLCTRIGIIEAGQLVTAGSLEEIYASLGL